MSLNETVRSAPVRLVGSVRDGAPPSVPSPACGGGKGGGPPHRSKRTSTCASNMNSKPCWAAALGATAVSLDCSRHRCDAIPTALFAAVTGVTREAPAVLFIKGIGVACRPAVLRALAPEGVRKRRPPRSRHHLKGDNPVRETLPADVPDALTRRNRNLSPSTPPS